MTRILAISGSLRAASSNTALLEAAALVAPDGITVELYREIGALPHFNPDQDGDRPPGVVVDLRERAGAADGLLISCPEYARGIPGTFKNALDWLVGSTNFANKPTALFNASPRATDAQAALRLVLTTMSASLVEEASVSIPLLAKDLDAGAIAADTAMSSALKTALNAFAAAIVSQRREHDQAQFPPDKNGAMPA